MKRYNDGVTTYDGDPNERPAQNRSEQVAAKMYGLAERTDSSIAPAWHEQYTKVATEFASGNYDKGQRLLEADGAWPDELREVAVEANRADRERVGENPFGFLDTRVALDRYAQGLSEIGDERGALSVDEIIRGMDRPGQTGLDGIDEALKYIEGVLQTKVNLEKQLTPEMRNQWKEQRAVRDALYLEKQKRIEELRAAEVLQEQSKIVRGSATRDLDNLYARVDVPEDTPSRQEILKKVGKMSPEELRILGIAIRKAGEEFNMTGDKDLLDATLFEFAHRDFTKEDLAERNEVKRQKDIGHVKRALGMESSDADSNNESPESRFKKYKKYEAHQRSAERTVKCLQDLRTFESANDQKTALSLFENTIANITSQGNDGDIEKLRGTPVNIEKEKLQFGIDDESVDDYVRLREAQNELANGKTVKDAADKLEGKLEEEYGVSKVDLKGVKNMKDLNALKVGVKMSAEETDNPGMVGQIKEVNGVGYHIPDVPVYNIGGDKIVNTINRDIKAGPSVVVYKAR